MFKDLINNGFEFYKKYYSSYRGLVVGFDDPLELGRVRVIVPEIHGRSATGFLAWNKGEWKGVDSGIQIPLTKGDMVWVEFEYGNASYPLYSYGHRHKGNTKPEEFTEEVYGIKTPKGITITCDDEHDLITVTNADGMHLIIDKGVITLGKEDGFELVIKDNEITLGKDKGMKINNSAVTLGSGSTLVEPLVKGIQLELFLTSLLTFLSTFSVITTAPLLPTTPNPATPAAISALTAQLQTLKSLHSKTD